MDRTNGTKPCSSRCVPRMRGDGPPVTRAWSARYECAPHARGWTCGGAVTDAVGRVCPACAGMDRRRLLWRCLCPCVPLTRGDGPKSENSRLYKSGCAPRTRGWTEGGLHPHADGEVCPACAGMDRTQTWATPHTQNVCPVRAGITSIRDRLMPVPRTRGDGVGIHGAARSHRRLVLGRRR